MPLCAHHVSEYNTLHIAANSFQMYCVVKKIGNFAVN